MASDAHPGSQYTVPVEGFAGAVVIQYDEHNPLNVLCLYAIHECGHTFESGGDFDRFVEAQLLKPEVGGLGDFAAFVVDTKRFSGRVHQVVQRRGFGATTGLLSSKTQRPATGSSINDKPF